MNASFLWPSASFPRIPLAEKKRTRKKKTEERSGDARWVDLWLCKPLLISGFTVAGAEIGGHRLRHAWKAFPLVMRKPAELPQKPSWMHPVSFDHNQLFLTLRRMIYFEGAISSIASVENGIDSSTARSRLQFWAPLPPSARVSGMDYKYTVFRNVRSIN